MTLRLITPPWSGQPQEAVPIQEDWRRKGLVYASTTLLWDAASGVVSTIRGARQQAAQFGIMQGFGPTLGTANNDAIRTGFTRNSNVRTYVVRFRRRGPGGSNLGRVFSKNTSGSEAEMLYANSGATNRFVFERQWTTGMQQYAWPNPPIDTDIFLILEWDGRSNANVPILWMNGEFVGGAPLGGSGAFSGAPVNNTHELVVGNRISDGFRGWDGLLSDVLIFDAILSDEDKLAISCNPHVVYEPQSIWVSSSAAAARVEFGGAAAAVASASGQLSTQIRMRGAGAAVSTASGALTTSVRLGGTASAAATSTGALSTGIKLTGSAPASASASGTLTTSIRLSGAAQAQAAAAGAIVMDPWLSGAAVAAATATGALTTEIRLAGAASSTASAAGVLAAPGTGLAGSAKAGATATGALETGIRLGGTASAAAIAAGELLTNIRLAAAATCRSLAMGSLANEPAQVGQVGQSRRLHYFRLVRAGSFRATNRRISP